MHIRAYKTKVEETIEETIEGKKEYKLIDGKEIGALVVGINKYHNQPSWTLFGCVRDAQRYRQLFINAYGIPASNIQTLYDSEATKDKIVRKLRYISDNFKYRAYAHSGHGFRIWNNQQKKHVEGLITYGLNYSRAGMLFDSDIYKILKNPERSWLIVDACHSGGLEKGSAAARNLNGQSVRVKSINLPLSIQNISLENLEAKTKDIVGLFACRPEQYAYETSEGGAYTNSFLDYVYKFPETPLDQIRETVEEKIPFQQNPVFIADDLTLPLFCVRT